MNDLYTTANNGILKELNLKTRVQGYSSKYVTNVNHMLFSTSIPKFYDYFMITNVSCNEYVNQSNGGYYTYGDNNGNYEVLTENVEYSLDEYINVWTNVLSTTDGKEAYCEVSIKYYNKW